MARRINVVLFTLALLATTVPAYSWGRLGHRTVAIIAEHRLNPQAKAAVVAILGDGTSLADISTCADDIKRKSIQCGPFKVKANPRSSSWHFVNIPIQATPTVASLKQYCRNHGKDDQCSTEQIKVHLAILKDPKASTYDKQIALMFVVHLVGDLSQPLHNANDGDAGGNTKLLRFMPTPRAHKKTNLHHIWDNMLMSDTEAKKRKPEALAADLEGDMSHKNMGAWSEGEIIDHSALESFAIAKARVYPAYQQAGGDDLGRDYQREMQPIAFEQVEKAGVRLAVLLNQALSGP